MHLFKVLGKQPASKITCRKSELTGYRLTVLACCQPEGFALEHATPAGAGLSVRLLWFSNVKDRGFLSVHTLMAEIYDNSRDIAPSLAFSAE